jgi:hypothetical protein
MNDYVKIATEAGDQYLTALAETQEQFLKYLKAFATWTPAAAAAPLPMMPWFAKASLPSPSEIISANFAFAEKMLKQQQAFTEKLFATSAPA